MKRAGRLLGFCILFALLLYGFNEVFVPKWEEDGLWEPATQIVDGFYEEEEQTIDVLYLGSSNSFYDINPLIIYEEQQLTGYVLGSGEQRLFTSYYYLTEALKYQSPKVVVLDTLGFFYEGKGEEEQNRKAYDYMRFSPDKIQSLQNASEKDQVLSYVVPFFRYHARWSSLTERDFLYPVSNKHYFLKGYAYSEKVVENLPKFDMNRIVHEGISIDEENKYYFKLIYELCKENGIQLVLIKTPNIEWGILEHSLMVELAKENNLPFYDYNSFMNEIGILEESCFLDGAHLNYVGAEKLSSHLGSIMAQEIKQPPEKKEHVKKQWDEDLNAYKNKRAE